MHNSHNTDHAHDDAVQKLAYHLWEQDGKPDGKSDHYWMMAREQLGNPGSAESDDQSKTEKMPQSRSFDE